MLLILLSALQGVDLNLERAALSLGASRFGVFRRVVVPLAAPGIVSAALFAFLASFDELVISLFLTGVRAQTLPVRIWNSLHLRGRADDRGGQRLPDRRDRRWCCCSTRWCATPAGPHGPIAAHA